MISFRYRNNIKRLQLTQRVPEERLSRMLNQVFNTKGPIIGFRSETGEYYDTESFCRQKARFYGETVDVMEASDQLEISFTSDNLSTSFVQQPTSVPGRDNANGDLHQQQKSTTSEISRPREIIIGNLGYVHDLRSVERIVLADPGSLSLVFVLEEQPYKTQLLTKLNALANRHQEATMFYHVLNSKPQKKFSAAPPLLLVYAGKKKICELAIRNNFEALVQSATMKWTKIQQNAEELTRNNALDDDCPSFITNNALERLSREAVEDYLRQMSQDASITIQEFRRLHGMLDERFVQFCRTYCRNLVDTDYQSFKGEVLLELQRSPLNDSYDQDRPISREEQRKSNLKKSVSDVEVVKVQNYLQILEGLSDLILQDELHTIKSLLIEENEEVMSYFSGFLSREYDKLTLANNLVIIAANSRTMARPISRCIPRNPRTHLRESPPGRPPSKQASPIQPSKLVAKSDTKPKQEELEPESKGLDLNVLKEELLKLEEVPEFGASRKPSSLLPQQKDIDSPCPSPQDRFVPPKARNSSFSPLKEMQQQSMENSYKNVQKLLLKRSDEFAAEQYGLWVHLLRACDPSIQQLVQQAEQSPNSQEVVENIKAAMDNKLDSIFRAEFIAKEMEYFVREKQIEGSPIHCFFENFRYEADLQMFLNELRKELRMEQPRLLKKKSSLPSLKKIEGGQLLRDQKANTNRSKDCSIEQDSFDSKDSAQKQEENRLEQLQAFYQQPVWEKEFHQMLQCVDLPEKTQQRLRRMQDDQSPQLFIIVREYINASQRNSPFGKSNIKMFMRKTDRSVGCGRLHKYTCFKYLLIALQNQGKLTDSKSRWLRTSFIDQNFALVSAFESYIYDKNEKELLDTMNTIMRMQSLRVQQTELDTFLNRIVFFMGQIYEHPNMFNFAISRYAKVFKGICELYHMNADSMELFENLDVLNSYCFEKRVAEELARSFLNAEERKLIIEHFNKQVIPLIEGIIDTLESGRDFASFVMRYVKDWQQNSKVKKLSAIEQIKSEERLESDTPQRAKSSIFQQLKISGCPPALLEKLELWDECDPKLTSLWQLYEVTHNDEELIENLEILLLTPQEDEHTRRFIENLFKSQRQQLTPAIRARLNNKEPKLMKLIRRHSFGSIENKEFWDSMEQYEREELPQIIREILGSFGLSCLEIDRALTADSQTVSKAVQGYMHDQKQQELMELLEKMVDLEDEPVFIDKPSDIPPESPVDAESEITD